jgi:hypothetical protein
MLGWVAVVDDDDVVVVVYCPTHNTFRCSPIRDGVALGKNKKTPTSIYNILIPVMER